MQQMVLPGRTVKCSTTRQRVVKARAPTMVPTKYHDDQPATSTTDASAPYTFGQIAAIATGGGEGQRVGNNMQIHELEVSVELRPGVVGNTGTSYQQDETFKVLIVCAKAQNTNADPGLTNVINVDNNGFLTPLSFRTVPFIDDYEIVSEKTFRVNADAPVNNSQLNKANHTWCVKFSHPIHQRYSGGTSTAIVENPLFAYVITDTAHTGTGGTNSAVTMSIRTIYTDTV